MKKGSKKSKITEGQISLGPFLKFSDASIAEIAGLAGFDHVIIDLEHGPLDILAAQEIVRAAETGGAVPMIRVSSNSEPEILRALDIGARGVHVPHVDDRASAEKAVRACYYHPKGERGVCRYVRNAAYTGIPKEEYFQYANDSVVPILHLEGKKAFENLDEILEVEGIGVVFIGPYDLSQSCGVPGQIKSEVVVSAMKDAVTRARAAGVQVGTFVESVGDARFWNDLGVNYLCYSVDVGIFFDACRQIAESFKKL